MKKIQPLYPILLLFAVTALKGQSRNEKNTLMPPPADIKIDGDLKEWGDSLRYYNEDKKLYYTLASDKDNVYMAIRLSDRSEQTRILGAGLTIGINTKGKKKADYTITFPVGDQNGNGINMMAARRNTGDEITQADRDELLRERLTRLRDIKVSGFKSIEGDMITTTNTYGIKAGIDYDANGYLVYEAAIPLKLFDKFDADKKEWAFDFKINGLSKPGTGNNDGLHQGGMGGDGMGGGMRGGRGGMGGMHGGGGMRGGRGGMGGMRDGETGSTDRSELFKSVDFWETFYLSK